VEINKKEKESKQVLVFDFDGTIADTFDLVLEIFQEVSGRVFSEEEIKQSRDLSTKELLKELKIPKLKVPFFIKRARQKLGERILRARPFEGLLEVLKNLSVAGYQQVILTSNSRENVDKFLKKYQMESFFRDVWADVGVFSKVSTFRKLAKQEDRRVSELVSIGDETRDIEAAKKVGAIAVAVTWGFDSKELLKKTGPDFLVESPGELRETLVEISSKSR